MLIILILGFLNFNHSIEAFAQENQTHTVTGIVRDFKSNDPLPGVNVRVKGTQTGTITSLNGSYSIQVAAGASLIFSYIGYDDIEQAVENQEKIDVLLKESLENLDEVVVIGYGSATKKEITGSITSLKSDDFNKGAYNDAMGLIQGKVAGLVITKPDGADPMAGYEIILRGTNTLTSGQGPLIIIDGVAGADLKNLNFEDVESVDVLKDGSAAAIYGTRGTNGVILISTKRAKTGETSIEYSSQVIAQVNPRSVRTLSPDEFRYAIQTYAPDKVGSIYGASTDWFKEITRSIPVSQKHSLAISGGTDKFSHRTTFNIENNQGLLKDNEAKRYLFKTNIHQNALEGHLEMDYNFIMGIRDYKPANYDLFYQAFIQNPTQPVYDPSNTAYGGYSSLPGIEYYNPVAMLKERQRSGKSNDLGQNVRATLNLIPGLKWVNFISYEGSSWEENSYRTQYYPSRIGRNGEAEISNGGNHNLQYESTVNYSRSFNKHNIQALGGYTYQEFGSNSSYMINSGFDTDIYGVNNIGAGSALQEGMGEMGSYKESNKLISFFGRLMYNYDGKYLASASFRREGSSRFGINNKWGSFPALSLGWRLKKESFMENVTWLNDLKLRAGYGVTGNQDFANYKSMILMGRAGKFFYNGAWINSYQPVSNPNPDLRWEKKQEFNIGADFSVLNNRLGGSLDYYYRTSKDLLYTYNVAVPPYLYKELFTNLGTISNQGVELSLNGRPLERGNIQWNTIFTFTKNINKLKKFSNDEFTNKYIDIGWIGGAIPLNSQRIEEGQSLGNFYGPVWLNVNEYGLDQFKNANPIGKVNPSDWEVMGNAYPFAVIGWSNSVTFKNWDFNMSLRSNIGGKVLNLYRLYYENWQNIGTKNIVHTQLENPEFVGNAIYSSKYVEDATFLKLDNISIGYNLKIRQKYIKSLRLSLLAQDVFCITGYKGLDPEVNLSGLEPGIERLSYYPRTTSVTFGLNISF
ncbi:MAG: SusC/RagA family TonB-linked outer membrane protein [Bacteroidales bacterium]|nr:SusC/RagA family TonB-linked outer membrane protein [Bacteroidales bacterium]MCB8999957.1 SusC/RagA family TonB-linked outer membrane protein [Bacteroidales bacterium]MCB9012592.1 SusC/RagA family TonB-linked outer membrane protein [Bacteroidales bacterium]